MFQIPAQLRPQTKILRTMLAKFGITQKNKPTLDPPDSSHLISIGVTMDCLIFLSEKLGSRIGRPEAVGYLRTPVS